MLTLCGYSATGLLVMDEDEEEHRFQQGDL